MKNYNESAEKNHNPKWPYITDIPYRLCFTMLLNLINHQQPNFYKIYFYIIGTFKPKYPLPINEI